MFRRASTNTHFQLQFRQFVDVTMPRQMCWQVHDSTPKHISWYIQTYILHTKAYFIVHTNIHFAHQSISYGTHETFILHTKVCHQWRFQFRVYNADLAAWNMAATFLTSVETMTVSAEAIYIYFKYLQRVFCCITMTGKYGYLSFCIRIIK